MPVFLKRLDQNFVVLVLVSWVGQLHGVLLEWDLERIPIAFSL